MQLNFPHTNQKLMQPLSLIDHQLYYTDYFFYAGLRYQSGSSVDHLVCVKGTRFELIPNYFDVIKWFYLYQNTVFSSYIPVPKKQIRICANGIKTIKTRKLSRSAPWKCSWSSSRRRYHLRLFCCIKWRDQSLIIKPEYWLVQKVHISNATRLTSEYTEYTGTPWWYPAV